MSNPSRVTNNRNEIQIETSEKGCLSNIIGRIRSFCDCSSPQNEENIIPLVHAVDSVRLVYMRRIEEASLLNLRRQNQPDEQSLDEIQPRIIRYRRMKQEKATIEALEKALKEYESKHKSIISSTRVPDSISFDKTCKITRSSQTDKEDVIKDFIQTVGRVNVKDSFANDEEISFVVLNTSNDKWTNTENIQNENVSIISKKELLDDGKILDK